MKSYEGLYLKDTSYTNKFRRCNLIVALCRKNNGIGLNNSIPWHIKDDLKQFKKITTHINSDNTIIKNVVIMGRKTWDSIPEKFKPLSDRINIIITKNVIESKYKDTYFFNNYDSIFRFIASKNINEIFIIGGSQIYEHFLSHDLVDKLYITEIYNEFECDRFFPSIDQTKFKITNVSNFKKENDIHFRYITYNNINNIKDNQHLTFWKNKEEELYLQTLNKIISEGIETNDRTGVGTYSIFGEKFEYDISDTIPALTTKRIFFRGIFEELMLYISGKTDNSILNEKNIHIWDGNTTREFLDKRNLSHYPENDMGETYGFNFRHYGETYKTCKDDYTNKGFDQLSYVIDLIKHNPNSRRIIINLWNPATMHKAALPACLCFYQFYVDTKNKKLNLQIYIRSSDFFLANNWNTVTGALLVYMICNLKDVHLTPGILKLITGDTHIYSNHLTQVKENLKRTPKPFPKLIIKETKETIEDYCFEDFKLIGYYPDKNINAPMAV